MLSEDVRTAIGEMLRLEKNRNADMLYDLMLYGELKDEDGEPLIPNTIKDPEKKSVVIDYTKDNPEITEITTNMRDNSTTIKKETAYKCNNSNCRHNKDGFCESDVINKLKKKCDKTNGYLYFEAKGA